MPFLDLPVEILTCIFRKLRLSDLRNVMLCCKVLRQIVLDDGVLWTKNAVFLIQEISSRKDRQLTPYNRCRISHNWKYGIFRDRVILQHHADYMPWLNLQDQYLLVSTGWEMKCYPRDKKGAPQCNQLLWKIEVPKVLRKDIRTNDISRFLVKSNFILCANRDGCISVYDWTERTKPKLTHHIRDCHNDGQVEVSAIEAGIFSDQITYLASVSDYGDSVKFWTKERKRNNNFVDENCKLMNNLSVGCDQRYFKKNNHVFSCTSEVQLQNAIGARCLALDGTQTKLAIGLNGNSRSILLDVNTGTILLNATYSESRRQVVRDIEWLDPNTIAYVTNLGHLQCVDTRTGRVTFDAIDPFQSSLYCLKTDKSRAVVVGSSQYSRCVLFDLRTNRQHVQIYFTQKKSSPVYSVDFDSFNLLAAADNSIAAINFNVAVSSASRRDYSEPFEFIS